MDILVHQNLDEGRCRRFQRAPRFLLKTNGRIWYFSSQKNVEKILVRALVSSLGQFDKSTVDVQKIPWKDGSNVLANNDISNFNALKSDLSKTLSFGKKENKGDRIIGSEYENRRCIDRTIKDRKPKIQMPEVKPEIIFKEIMLHSNNFVVHF